MPDGSAGTCPSSTSSFKTYKHQGEGGQPLNPNKPEPQLHTKATEISEIKPASEFVSHTTSLSSPLSSSAPPFIHPAGNPACAHSREKPRQLLPKKHQWNGWGKRGTSAKWQGLLLLLSPTCFPGHFSPHIDQMPSFCLALQVGTISDTEQKTALAHLCRHHPTSTIP